jgi:hypothetical protein
MRKVQPPSKRITMIKHVVGKVRASYFDSLPGEDFTYGMKTPKQEMTAGSIISQWSTHLDSKSQRQNDDANTYQNKAATNENQGLNNYDKLYGIKNVMNNIPMKELLQCPQSNVDEADYPDRSHMKKKGRLPTAKSTRASRYLVSSIKKASEVETDDKSKNQFKMRRFLKVESKVKSVISGAC